MERKFDSIEKELLGQVGPEAEEQLIAVLESEEEHNKRMESMQVGLELEDSPDLGTFWYLPKENQLILVAKTAAEDLQFNQNGQKTTKRLHYQIWAKEYNKAKSLNLPWKYGQDYTKVPRGRVWEVKDGGFMITVGEWINQYPQAKELIIQEFNLPQNTKFIIDSHWNIGSGWSGDRF